MDQSPQELGSLIKSLPLEIEPTTDLWPEITSQLTAKPQPPQLFNGPWLIAASIAASIATLTLVAVFL